VKAPNGQKGKRKRANGNGTCEPAVALTVRPAGRSDAVPLGFFFDAVLRKDYFLRRGQLADMLKSPYHQVYVAELDTVLVGVAVTTRGTRLVNALVHPAYRGLGIGRALVQYSGATEVRAKIDMSTGDPRAFYRSLGFESAGRVGKRNNIENMRLATNSAGR
jgi:GNAT superfamily N-acetyltransferase